MLNPDRLTPQETPPPQFWRGLVNGLVITFVFAVILWMIL